MAKQNIGGVQAHSVGPHYPVIVVGFGDGTWRAEYGNAHSGRFERAWQAERVATLAHGILTQDGEKAARLWLLNKALPGKLVFTKDQEPLPRYASHVGVSVAHVGGIIVTRTAGDKFRLIFDDAISHEFRSLSEATLYAEDALTCGDIALIKAFLLAPVTAKPQVWYQCEDGNRVVVLRLTNDSGHVLDNSRSFVADSPAAEFLRCLQALIGIGASDATLLALF